MKQPSDFLLTEQNQNIQISKDSKFLIKPPEGQLFHQLYEYVYVHEDRWEKEERKMNDLGQEGWRFVTRIRQGPCILERVRYLPVENELEK